MTLAAAFLVAGSPLPYLRKGNPPWAQLTAGYKAAARSLAAARPDVILLYSTQWIAVLDELWQTRQRVSGVHVDENWYEYGDLSYDLKIDTALAEACVAKANVLGIQSKGVDYDAFPIDTGTIVANGFLNPDGAFPLVLAANNVYHDFEATRRIASLAAETAEMQGKRYAVVGVGGLSGTIFRDEINIAEDRLASSEDDKWNRRILDLMEKGETRQVEDLCSEYAGAAKVDMGFKHLAWVLGATGGQYKGARIHGYGPTYGAGAAVIEFKF
jgi:2-aminophenol/2-amino-5-chlorophenol 1,6-dioxygenase alpha subunit